MSIIQTTDFILNETLPIDELGSVLQTYITKYEPEILRRVLSYSLWKEFNTAIAGGSPAQKWVDLRDGAEYTWNGKPEFFTGVKELTVDYVYFKFIKQNSEYASGVGIKKIQTENSENADPSYKQTIAYNDMVDINSELYQFITAKNEETADTYENYNVATFNKIIHFNF
jgi:hypothetical protein